MVIGGSGSIVGSILGGAFYVLVPQLTNLVDPSLTALLQGAILLVVLFLLPGGLVSLPRALTRGRRRSRRRARPCRATYHSVVDHRVGHRGGGTRNREARSRMSSHSRSRTAFRVVAGASALALMLAGCGGRGGDSGSSASGGAAASPGITDTALTLGITTPLSGATAGPGTCTVAGVKAYFGEKNAAGGVKFGDGKTRKVEIKALDDAYDPQKAKANYDQLKGSVFAMTAGLGTPTNRAWRQAAIADKVPQVLVMTGDPIFSDSKQSPWQLGFVPKYQNEGEAFGKLLATSTGQHKVAILSQNDDYGKGYVEGFKSAIKGKGNIQVVKELTYEATDTSVDAQITELACSGADVFFNAMSVTPLMISSLQKAQQLNGCRAGSCPPTRRAPGRSSSPAGPRRSPACTPSRSRRRRRARRSPRTPTW